MTYDIGYVFHLILFQNMNYEKLQLNKMWENNIQLCLEILIKVYLALLNKKCIRCLSDFSPPCNFSRQRQGSSYCANDNATGSPVDLHCDREVPERPFRCLLPSNYSRTDLEFLKFFEAFSLLFNAYFPQVTPDLRHRVSKMFWNQNLEKPKSEIFE